MSTLNFIKAERADDNYYRMVVESDGDYNTILAFPKDEGFELLSIWGDLSPEEQRQAEAKAAELRHTEAASAG